MSDDIEKSQSASENSSITPANPHLTAEEIKAGVFSILRRVAMGGGSSPFQKSRLYPNAFEMNEDLIKRLDSRVREQLGKLPLANNGEILFKGEVRFPDLSTEKFDDLNILLDKAGDKRDPESLAMRWVSLLVEPIGTIAQVDMVFTTEQPLETKELGLLDFDLAQMKLEIGGPFDSWVEQTYQILNPFFETARLSGIYRPLLIFRNRNIVLVLSLITAIFVDNLVSRILSVYINTPVYVDEAAYILSQPNLESKFDAFITKMYEVQSPLGSGLAILGVSIVTYLISLVICYILYPKLVPRSAISIGLAKIRFSKYQNAFRFVVFTIILSGFILPLLYTLISRALGLP
jgi:hypothetical protein